MFPGPVLTTEPGQANGMVFSQRLIVPADRPADLVSDRVDPPGRMMGRGDAAGKPIVEPHALAELGRDSAKSRSGLSFEVHQIQFRHPAVGPQVRREADFRDHGPVEVKGQGFDRPGTEVPADDDSGRRHTA